MLLESSIMLLENTYNTGVTHDDCHIVIVICLKYRPHKCLWSYVKDIIGSKLLFMVGFTFCNQDFCQWRHQKYNAREKKLLLWRWDTDDKDPQDLLSIKLCARVLTTGMNPIEIFECYFTLTY